MGRSKVTWEGVRPSMRGVACEVWTLEEGDGGVGTQML